MRSRVILTPILVIGLVTVLIGWSLVPSGDRTSLPATIPNRESFAAQVTQLDEFHRTAWDRDGVVPAPPAQSLELMRRLSLALHGTIPSLEEIRQFERELATGDSDEVITRWTLRLLRDRRFADYFGERLARSLVGTENGAFVIYRRDRFVEWLSEQLAVNRPYDQIVREIIAEQGLWTGRPAVNFVTAAVAEGEIDRDKLTGKTVRAFLGQRIDCAQCHDHPFAHWKQSEYQGLTAFYGELNLTLVGVEDKPRVPTSAENSMLAEQETFDPVVPFHTEWLHSEGTLRQRLAGWVTHPENRRFERAISNRVWTLLLGTPAFPDRAVDDLDDPPEQADLLDLLGIDFRENGYDLQRLILTITATERFRMSSQSSAETDQEYELLKRTGAVFPIARLRPEQLIGAMLQASSVKTIDQNSHLFARATRFFRELEFVRDYGDLGPDELEERSATVSQALLRMNGNLTRDIITASPLNSSFRVARLSASDEECLENCFLVCLTRRPNDAERAYFLAQLKDTQDEDRSRVVEDLFWSLFNSEEFSWNH